MASWNVPSYYYILSNVREDSVIQLLYVLLESKTKLKECCKYFLAFMPLLLRSQIPDCPDVGGTNNSVFTEYLHRFLCTVCV